MDNPSSKNSKNLGLRIFFIFLTIIIVGLITTIIVVNKKNTELNDDIGMEEYNNRYFAEVDRIYNNNPENITKVIDYFTNKINDNKDDDMSMNNAIRSEIEWFKLRNIDNDEALLEGLMRIDYSYLIDEEAYNYYSEIIEMADELGKNDIVERYSSLRNEIKEEFLKALEASKKNIEEILDGLELDTPDEYKEIMKSQYEDILDQIEKYKEENE